jgi:MSHA pilin protein MshA
VIKIQQTKLRINLEKKSFSGGFTLIELIMVIVILGILAAFALPKFADVSTDARLATLKSLEGAMRSAAGIVHAKALVENKTDCAANPTVVLEGRTITLRCGYPCPHPNGIGNAVAADSSYTFVGGNCGGQLGAVDVRLSNAPNPSACKITYTSARQNRQPGTALIISGC